MIRLTLQVPGGATQAQEFDGLSPVGIGRASGNALRIADSRVSGLHGQIALKDGAFVYRDLRSTNGSMVLRGAERTVVDGEGTPDVALRDGDILLLGDVDDPIAVHVAVPRARPAGPASEGTVVARRPLERGEQLAGGSPGLAVLLRSLAAETDVEGVFRVVAEHLTGEMQHAEAVTLITEGEPAWRLRRSSPEIERLDGDPPPWPRGLVAEALDSGEGVLAAEESALDTTRSLARFGATSAIVAPLVHGKERLGALCVTGRGFGERDLDLVVALAWLVTTSFATQRLLSKMRALERRLRDENRYLRHEVERDSTFGDLVGTSAGIRAVFDKMRVVMTTDASVLVLGETGTGKELVARAIHRRGKRSERLFAAVNCAALTETLLESELFGHMKGAFTGATDNKKGLFQVADGGTLFLDEIGELSPKLQAKLLRVLQEGEVMPVGSTRPIKVDVRIIAATHRDLRAEAKAGTFREDLFYRINVFPIRIPPLRERTDDIPALAQAFVDRYAKRFGKSVPGLTDAALAALAAYPFPGNIRELENEIQRAVLLAPDGSPIDARHLSDELGGPAARATATMPVGRAGPLKETMERLEREVIRGALEENGWNRSQTARVLGISRQALMVKLAKMGLAPD